MNGNSIPRGEYPRPDFLRESWLSLNGEWEFSFDDENIGEKEGWITKKKFNQTIIVPFCYQSKLSEIADTTYHKYMWYKKEFILPKTMQEKRIILNFGAVDYRATVWINGNYLGQHKGGYTPFKFDITRHLKSNTNSIVLQVEDGNECIQPRGKQYWKENPDRCWYTPTSGIWQSVWLEAVGEIAIDKIRMTPDINNSTVLVETFLDEFAKNLSLKIKVYYQQKEQSKFTININNSISRITIDLKEVDYIDEVHYWSPESPNLYDIEFVLLKDGQVLDNLKSYFGMRKISVKDDIILLNNRPYYQKLILDQGYWEESLMTPPSDEAIIFDIEMTKKFGFNGARKHQKIEDPRYYYWADKLGLLVWGEVPSAYDFNVEEINNITIESIEFINRDYNHPCIIAWVPLNESWGVRNIISNKNQQSFASSLYHLFKAMDHTRLVSTNDGWEQVEDTDICAIHDYGFMKSSFNKYHDREKLMNAEAQHRMIYASGHRYKGIPVLITEYGGIAFASENEEEWGYFDAVKDAEEFLVRYKNITTAIKDITYVRGYCYTQLTDVFQEANGLMTMKREVKIKEELIKEVNDLI